MADNEELTNSIGQAVLQAMQSAVNPLVDALNKNTEAKAKPPKPPAPPKDPLKELEKNIKDYSARQAIFTKIFDERSSVMGAALDGLSTRFKAVGKALGDGARIVMDSIKNAQQIGITAQEGFALEVGNQIESFKSIFTLDPNTIFSREELQQTSQAAASALGGFSKGLEPSAGGLRQFRTDLANAGIFGQVTSETFQALAFSGATTAAEINQLRAATGRQSINVNTLSGVINKNITSVNVFGNAILKRALDFERLGITLDSLVKGQESYVTSLDQQIDAVAQLGQLGTAIDFEKLTMLQEFGEPGQAQEYISSLINAEDLRSSSYRALLGQISGIDVQEIMKIKNVGNFEKLEQTVTKNSDETNKLTGFMTGLGKVIDTLTKLTIPAFVIGLTTATVSLVMFSTRLASIMRSLPTPVPPGTPAGPAAGGTTTTGGGAKPTTRAMAREGAGAGAAVGVGTGVVTAASTIMAGGSWKKALLMGVAPILGGVLGGVLGGAISAIPLLTPFAGVIVPLFSGLGTTLAAAVATKFADDMISMPGYGERTLVTPSGNIALNNNDMVMAGTNLFNKGTLQAGGTDNAPLLAKIDRLVSTIENASTTISVGGQIQKVPRFQLVGVRSRNEVE